MTMRPIQRSDQRTPQRMPVIRTSLNRFDVDVSKIPEGMGYEWKRRTIVGMEDTEGLINCEANGWTAVPPERHPELTGSRASNARTIERGGLVLMERPKQITEQVIDMQEFDARNAIANQMRRLQIGGHRAAGRGIRTNYELPPTERQIPE